MLSREDLRPSAAVEGFEWVRVVPPADAALNRRYYETVGADWNVLLTAAVETAWELPGTERVRVHTCTDDHDGALPNYQKRGFQVFRVENSSGTD